MGDQWAACENRPAIDKEAESLKALTWLIEQVKMDQWPDIARALKLVQENGGFGKIILVVRDGRIVDHPKAELSL